MKFESVNKGAFTGIGYKDESLLKGSKMYKCMDKGEIPEPDMLNKRELLIGVLN